MMSICQGAPEVQAVQVRRAGQGRHDAEAEVMVQDRRVDMEVDVPVPDQKICPERAYGIDHGACAAPVSPDIQLFRNVSGFCLRHAGHFLPGSGVIHAGLLVWCRSVFRKESPFSLTCWAPFFMEKNDKIFHPEAGKKAHAGV